MNETLQPGKYYLGDPTYVLPNKILIGIWGNDYNYDNGKYTVNGHEFIVHNTHYGNGIYKDTRDRIYKVDCGVIGLVNMELIEDINKINGNGYIYEFKEKIKFYYDSGTFIVKSGKKYIKIDTQNNEEYDSEEDISEKCLNEEGEHISKVFCNDSDDEFIEDENENMFGENEEEEEENKNENSKKIIQFFKKK